MEVGASGFAAASFSIIFSMYLTFFSTYFTFLETVFGKVGNKIKPYKALLVEFSSSSYDLLSFFYC